jgi:hypothetical protein
MLKALEMNQIGIGNLPLAKIDADDSILIVQGEPGAEFFELVNLLGVICDSRGGEDKQEEDRGTGHANFPTLAFCSFN